MYIIKMFYKIAVIMLLITATSFSAIKTSNMLLGMPMEGNANDICGGSTTVVGGATVGTGKLGKGYDFDGTNGYISIADNTQLSAIGAKTVCAWFKGTDTAKINCIVSKDYAFPNREWSLFAGYSGGAYIDTREFDGKSTGTGYLRAAGTTASTIFDGNWHHIAYTFDGINATGHIKIYCDGKLVPLNMFDVLVGSGAVLIDGSGAVNIGRFAADNAKCVTESIDDVQIYNRALPETDIRRIMIGLPPFNSNSFRLPHVPNATPSILYHFDEGTGSFAYDAIDNSTASISGYGWVDGKYRDGKYKYGVGANNVNAGNIIQKQPISVPQEFTVGIWIKPYVDLTQTSSYYGTNMCQADIISNVKRPDDATMTNWSFLLEFWRWYNSTGYGFLSWSVACGGTRYANGNGYRFETAYAQSIVNQWVFVVATAKKNGLGVLYINGVNVDSFSIPDVDINQCVDNLVLGNTLETFGAYHIRPFNGAMDEFFMINRQLSDSEVKQLYDESNLASGDVLDNFNSMSGVNNWGGQYSSLNVGSGRSVNISYDETAHSGNGACLKVSYNVPNSDDFVGVGIGFANPGVSCDISKYRAISFDIKGADLGQSFKIEWKNINESTAAAIYLSSYLDRTSGSNGGTGTDWETVTIPLDAFANFSSTNNLKDLGHMSLIFEHNYLATNGMLNSTTFYIDNIVFSTTAPNAVRIDSFGDASGVNALGAHNGDWTGGTGGSCTSSYDTTTSSGAVRSWKVNYSAPTGSYVGTYMLFGGTTTLWGQCPHDFSQYSKLKFRMKANSSTENPETFKLELVDSGGTRNVVPTGITTSWQEYSIDLTSFSGLDKTTIQKLSTVFEDWRVVDKTGVVYFDDIRFEK
ncbi:MAG: hypothetical protein M0Q46_02140 [Endomicrobiales bacterium]|nr:hypothetical protein [Endomicrobiales bacterium]